MAVIQGPGFAARAGVSAGASSAVAVDAASLPTSPRSARRSAAHYVRLGWAILLLGFGGFVAWAALAPLDGGAALDGHVTVSSYRKTIQHPNGGVVERVLVQEGQTVRQGQVLAVIDDSVARAESQAARDNRDLALARQARLLAERADAAQVVFPAELLDRAGEPAVAAAMALQAQLFEGRRQALAAELSGLRQAIAGALARAQGQQSHLQSLQAQWRAQNQRFQGIRQLAQENHVPRNRMYEAQAALADTEGQMALARAEIERGQREADELRDRLTQREQTHQQDIRTDLAAVQRELGEFDQRLAASGFALTHAQLRAPVDGRVVDLKLHTVGGVVRAGEPLLDILPDDDPLQVEARVGVDMIDRVAPGQPVDLLFLAFNRNTTPRVAGEVVRVSPDRLMDEATRQPYYMARVQVLAQGMQDLQGLRIQPGMPVQAFVRTGERSLLNYLFKPLSDRARTAFGGE